MTDRNLPKEQDELLRELHEVESLDQNGILPERSNTNLFLLGLTWALAIVVSIIFYQSGNETNNLFIKIFSIAIAFSLSFTWAYYHKNAGLYLSSLVSLGFNFYLSFFEAWETKTSLIVLIDGITVFIVANQFGRRGYLLALIAIVAKNTYLYIYQDYITDLYDLAALIINISITGIIPVLIRSISSVSRHAKAQEISSKILALQNEDLLKSWVDMYQHKKPEASPSSIPGQVPQPLQSQHPPPSNPDPIDKNQESTYTQMYK